MAARADYEVVGYRPDLRGQLYALQKHLWGQDLDASVWADYLDWKYSRNPYVDTPLIYAVIHAGEVVGMRGCGAASGRRDSPPRSWWACAAEIWSSPPVTEIRASFRR